MNASAVLSGFRKKFKGKITNAKLQKVPHKSRRTNHLSRIWFDIKRDSLKDAVRYLCEKYPDPHFAVCSGYDTGDKIELLYHFTVNYASKLGEIVITMKVKLSKKEPFVDTITDLIPGAIISEREMQEMLGIIVRDIPDSRRLFLDDSYPKGLHPWRKDETGPDRLARNLNTGRKL